MYIPARPTAVSEFHPYAIVYKILHAQSQDRKLGSPPLFAISAPITVLLFECQGAKGVVTIQLLDCV